ncbi:MAG: IS607 family transposase [Rivularia sp. (in: cyanobacteria)]
MKLSDYAKKEGISYQTAWRMWKRGELNAKQLPSGTIIVNVDSQLFDDEPHAPRECVLIYARVSSAENKANLDSQALRVEKYCVAKGYRIIAIVKEVGSGVNDSRKKLLHSLSRDDYNLIVCEHKDRLTRFGFNYIKTLLNKMGKDIEVINEAREEKEDLMQDFVSIITSFCARIYGLRRQKRKKECIINCLEK